MKRILYLAVTLLFILCSVTSAAEYTVSDGKISLSGNADTASAGKRVSLLVLKSGVSYGKLLEATPDESGELILFADTFYTASGGAFSKEIKLPSDVKPASFVVVLGDEAFDEADIFSIIYATDTNITAIIDDFNDADTKSLVISFLDSYEAVLGCVVKNNLKSEGFYSFLASKTTEEDGKEGLLEISGYYKEAMLKESVSAAKSIDELSEALNDYSSEKPDELFDEIKRKGLSAKLVELIKGESRKDGAETIERLKEAIFLTLFNNATDRNYMAELFEENNDQFVGVSSSLYAGVDKQALFRTLAIQAAKTPFKTGAELKAAVTSAIKDQSNKPAGGGSGGGGGGASSGKNIDVYLPEEKFTFTDIEGVSWAQESIYALTEIGVISEDPGRKFRPQDSVTREEYVKMLVTALGIYDENAVCNFSDVNPESWYAPYIASAYNKGLVKGVSDSEFGVGRKITRQDIAVMIYRGASAMGISFKDGSTEGFADSGEISSYAKEAVGKMAASGILNGYEDKTFRPVSNATRAEAAVITAKIYNMK